jgi:hypothetical protein
MPSRPDLPALLVAHQIASSRDVERVVRARGEEPIWRAILDAGVVTSQRLFELLRDAGGLPVPTDKALLGAHSAAQLSRILSKDEALRRGMLAFDLSADGRRAQIAMVDPTDEPALREVARAASLQAAKVFVVERGTLLAAIERAYSARARRQTGQNSVEPAAKGGGQRSEAEASERVERVLVQASLALGAALERELAGQGGLRTSAIEAARLAREIARELGYDRRRVALVGLAALLVQLDVVQRARRSEGERPLAEQLSAEVGWAGGGEDGLLAISRALAAQAAGFGKQPPGGALQRIVQVVVELLALGGPEGESIDLDAAEQLLRASTGGGPAIDALMRILRRELAERTPAAATVLPEVAETAAESGDGGEGLTRVRTAPRDPRLDHEDRTKLVSLSKIVPPGESPHEG